MASSSSSAPGPPPPTSIPHPRRRKSLVPTLHHVLLTYTTTTTTKNKNKNKNAKAKTKTVKINICGTYTSPNPARAAARRRLFDEGYTRKHFASVAYNQGQAGWGYGDDVVVRAETVDDDDFEERGGGDGGGGGVVEVKVCESLNTLGVGTRRGSVVEREREMVRRGSGLEREKEREGKGGKVGVGGVEMENGGNRNGSGSGTGVRKRGEEDDGRVEGELFYVVVVRRKCMDVGKEGKLEDVQEKVDVSVKGSHLSRQSARLAARHALLEYEEEAAGEDGKGGFEEWEDVNDDENGEEESVVRAVGKDRVRYEVLALGES